MPKLHFCQRYKTRYDSQGLFTFTPDKNEKTFFLKFCCVYKKKTKKFLKVSMLQWQYTFTGIVVYHISSTLIRRQCSSSLWLCQLLVWKTEGFSSVITLEWSKHHIFSAIHLNNSIHKILDTYELYFHI